MVNLKSIFIIGAMGVISALNACDTSSGRQVSTEQHKVVQNAEVVNRAVDQYERMLREADRLQIIPRTVEKNQTRATNSGFDWTEGFFPGSCWYLYELTKDVKWKEAAERYQEKFAGHRFIKTNHDLGFVFGCSYGNGLRLTGNKEYMPVLIDAGNSLITRFNEEVGCIQSWDVDKGWQSKRGWSFPVIIDNMMNLEMLFELSRLTGDEKYKEIAIRHANTTLTNHFRPDNSSYHVIDYDSTTGKVRKKETAQGFSHESVWARGQAWGLYGYTLCYKYTQDPAYLDQAKKIAAFIRNNPLVPEDHVPYWDYSAPRKPNEPRDASAAAITASALIQLSDYAGEAYLHQAIGIMNSLSSDSYLAKAGENHNFLLKHSTGSIPHGVEIDVPINYADYYFLEALVRLNDRGIALKTDVTSVKN